MRDIKPQVPQNYTCTIMWHISQACSYYYSSKMCGICPDSIQNAVQFYSVQWIQPKCYDGSTIHIRGLDLANPGEFPIRVLAIIQFALGQQRVRRQVLLHLFSMWKWSLSRAANCNFTRANLLNCIFKMKCPILKVSGFCLLENLILILLREVKCCSLTGVLQPIVLQGSDE